MDPMTERRVAVAVVAIEMQFARTVEAALLEAVDAGRHQDLLTGFE